MRPHKKLVAWQSAIELVNEIYIATMNFPDSEKFGIISQLRRAAVSVASNIAEGSARHSNKESIQFHYIALGSLSEIDTLLIISRNIKFLPDTLFKKLEIKSEKTSALITGLINYLKRKK